MVFIKLTNAKFLPGRDTLRQHFFDRCGRFPKKFVVLETPQLQNAIARFELLRRTLRVRPLARVAKLKTPNLSVEGF